MPRATVPRKKLVLDYAEATGCDSESYRFFEIPKSTFYRWKRAYAREGIAGLRA